MKRISLQLKKRRANEVHLSLLMVELPCSRNVRLFFFDRLGETMIIRSSVVVPQSTPSASTAPGPTDTPMGVSSVAQQSSRTQMTRNRWIASNGLESILIRSASSTKWKIRRDVLAIHITDGDTSTFADKQSERTSHSDSVPNAQTRRIHSSRDISEFWSQYYITSSTSRALIC